MAINYGKGKNTSNYNLLFRPGPDIRGQQFIGSPLFAVDSTAPASTATLTSSYQTLWLVICLFVPLRCTNTMFLTISSFD